MHLINLIIQFSPTVLTFLFIVFGLGHLIHYFFRINHSNFYLEIATGLSALIALGALLNLLSIPINFIIYLIIAFPGVLLKLKKSPTKIFAANPLSSLNFQSIILIFLFIFLFWNYCVGPFNYAWLEDDDPWWHAASIKYIALTGSIDAAKGSFQYLNPYPPGYGILMGLMAQTHSSISWVMKFFNGLIIVLGYLFFYTFAKELTQNEKKALWATGFLTGITCYLSHFIWAHSLAVTLFFPAFYWLIKADRHRHRVWLAGITIAGIFLTQPTQSIKFIIMVILMGLAYQISYRKLPKHILKTLCLGGLISLLWWGPVIWNGLTKSFTLTYRSGEVVDFGSLDQAGPKLADSLFSAKGGTATRSYTWQDYLYVPESNMINNPTGVGVVLCLLAFWGVIYLLFNLISRNTQIDAPPNQNQRFYSWTVILWLIFIFLGMNSMTFNLPFGLFAFRFWMLFAIPVCILAAESTTRILEVIQTKALRYTVIALIIFGVWGTSARHKLNVNTAVWPWGVGWGNYTELGGYMWLKDNLPVNTRIFTYSLNYFVIGIDMMADFWTDEYKKDFSNAIDLSAEELHRRLQAHNYEYFVIGQKEIREHGLEKVNVRVKEVNKLSTKFEFIYGTGNGCRIYKII